MMDGGAMSNPDRYRLELTGPLESRVRAAQQTYETWIETQDDYFRGDDEPGARVEFALALEQLVRGMTESGLQPGSFLADLRHDYSRAASHEFFGHAVNAGLVKTAKAQPVIEGARSRTDSAPTMKSAVVRRCSQCGSDASASSKFCASCGGPLPVIGVDELLPVICSLEAEVAALRQEVKRQRESALPQTGLLSTEFLTRAFAVYGHALVAGLIVSVPIYLIVLLLGLAS